MAFKKLAPQTIESTDGYRVQIESDDVLAYIEGNRTALVEFQLLNARRMRVFEHRIQGWFVKHTPLPTSVGDATTLSDEDRKMIIDRMTEAYRWGGIEVSLVRG